MTDHPEAVTESRADEALSAVEPGLLDGRRRGADRFLAVAAREYRLMGRSRWTTGVTLLVAVFTAAVVAMGASDVGPGRFDAVAASLTELGVYLVPLVALAFGYDAIVGPATAGTLELLFALPIAQRRVVTGIFAGRALALASALLLGFLPGAVLVLLFGAVTDLAIYAVVALAAVATAISFLALGVLISALARGKTHALGAVLLCWLWFVLLHDLLALGAIAALDLSGTAVGAMVLANPADCFRVLALSQLDIAAGGVGSVLAAADLSVALVALALAGWTLGSAWLAARLGARRRL